MNFTSQLNAMGHSISHLTGEQKNTEIYLDRYLPVKILNMIRDHTEESIGDYTDRKEFIERIKDKFD